MSHSYLWSSPAGRKKKAQRFNAGNKRPAVESHQGRQKQMIAARFIRPFGTWLAFGLESQR